MKNNIMGMYWNKDNEFVIPLSIRVFFILFAILLIIFIYPFIILILYFIVFFVYAYLFYVNYLQNLKEKK